MDPTIIIVLVILLIILIAYRKSSSAFVGGKRRFSNDIVSELVGEKWILFSKKECPWCVKQAAELGGAYPNTIYSDSPEIKKHGVESFPTWYNSRTKQYKPGFRTKAQLFEMMRPVK